MLNLALLPLVWLSILASPALWGAASQDSNVGAFVPLRIEGDHNTTIFEGRIFTTGHNVTTPSGGDHRCDGTNLGAHPFPGSTATSALADAAKKEGFTFDGTFDPEFDDFFITRKGDSAETATQFWGLLVDFVFTEVGGCQEQVSGNTHVLWAFDAFNADAFLFLEGPHMARQGEPVTLAVGNPISGASVGDDFAPTDADGQVTVSFAESGTRTLRRRRREQ